MAPYNDGSISSSSSGGSSSIKEETHKKKETKICTYRLISNNSVVEQFVFCGFEIIKIKLYTFFFYFLIHLLYGAV